MRKSVFTIALLLGLQVSQSAGAQNEQVTLRVQHSVRPLVEKWVAEYTKINHDAAFRIVTGKATNTEHQISFVTEQADDAVFVARYAVLPVVTKSSEAAQLLGSKRLNAIIVSSRHPEPMPRVSSRRRVRLRVKRFQVMTVSLIPH